MAVMRSLFMVGSIVMMAQSFTSPQAAQHTQLSLAKSGSKVIPVVKHEKEAGGGYKPGSNLYNKQQSMADWDKKQDRKRAEPKEVKECDEDCQKRQKPSLIVIFCFL